LLYRSWANAGNGIMLHRHSDDGLLEHNDSFLNGDSGISLFDSDRAVVRNNLIQSNFNAGIRLSVGAADSMIQHNAVFDAFRDVYTICEASVSNARSSFVLESAEPRLETTVVMRNLFVSPRSGRVSVNPTLWDLVGARNKSWNAQATDSATTID